MNQLANGDPVHAEIMAVIARETSTFVDQDFAGWAACWVQDERTREVCVSSTFGTTVLEGWGQIARAMRAVFEDEAACKIEEFQRKNISMTVSGDIAHVVFEGHSLHGDGRSEQAFETRVLERGDHGWRILYASFVLHGHQMADTDRLTVDAKGNILCAPDAALIALRAHSGLQISHGRLRAKTPAWDKKLQSGLACAAEQHGYFQHYRYVRQNGQDFRLPVVLGETDDGGVSVCVLFVRDGMTFVETQNDGDIDARLSVAKVIYELSDGQMQLAKRIVSGDGLTAAAAALGISVNTARTHLSRVYAKTGINSQTALVRTLLSVG